MLKFCKRSVAIFAVFQDLFIDGRKKQKKVTKESSSGGVS